MHSRPTAAGCIDDLDAFALVGGQLDRDRVATVVAHADTCLPCRELIEGLCAAEASDSPPAGHGLRVGVDVPGGTYRIVEPLALGGMGHVYRAIDLALGRDVVLKVPRSRSPALLRRFQREVALAARLAHPGIVPIHTAGMLDDGTPFFVMPMIEGVPLDLALQRAANREQRLALLEHVVAVANTMAFVHRAGIVHRDLKPSNVLIGTFGETQIIDWGLAKDLRVTPDPDVLAATLPAKLPAPRAAAASISHTLGGKTTRPGDVLGTPAFMSPEQARGEAIDQRSDVYAIGAMLEQLLVGRLPRKAADAALAQAPAELVAVCKKAMAADRDDRYPDGSALAAVLRAATHHHLVAPAAADVGTRARGWLWVAAAAGIAAIAIRLGSS